MTIERAAKAICLADKGRIATAEHWRMLARATLEAIAEPTPEMIEAGQREFEQSHWEDVAAAVWRAEHRAMLKEPK